MGIKGDKLSNNSIAATQHLIDSLNTISNIKSKKMFGGHGIFYNDKMFAMVDSKGQCYLKADDILAKEFSTQDSVKHSKMPYTSIPQKILNHEKSLLAWVKKSIKQLS